MANKKRKNLNVHASMQEINYFSLNSIRNLVKKHYILSFFISLFMIYCVYAMLTPPSNTRNWQTEYSLQSHAIVDGDLVTIYDIRNQTYDTNGPTSLSYYNQTFDLSQLKSLKLYVITLSDFKGIAHTFFEFEFVNSTKITVSVEARREVGEEYSIWLGMLHSFEVFYVWSPVTDSVARRQIWQKPLMISYKIKADDTILRALFLQLITDTNDLQKNPRYYNTLFSTCTSNLLDAARDVYPNLPWTISRFFPGYATEYLYNLDLIDTNLTLEKLESDYLPVG